MNRIGHNKGRWCGKSTWKDGDVRQQHHSISNRDKCQAAKAAPLLGEIAPSASFSSNRKSTTSHIGELDYSHDHNFNAQFDSPFTKQATAQSKSN
jgi:hypothetical protein